MQMAFSTRYTQAQLIEAVATSQNIRQVCLALGIRGRGGNYETIRRHIAQLGLGTSHFHGTPGRDIAVQRRLFDEPLRVKRTQLPVTLEGFEVAVASSRSIAEVARRVGLSLGNGQTYGRIHALIERHGLDTSHFTGQGWSRGQALQSGAARPLREVLVKGRSCQSSKLRRRLIKEGLKAATCEGCKGSSWLGHPMPLELDHINGDRSDNRIENLRLLCPNCHALTDSYRGRNIGRRSSGVADTSDL
jgi:hypothetical protein